MSLDPSLKTKASLTGKRSVMKRDERIAKMAADKKFDPKKDKALGIPKTLVPKA
ncbi:MAG: small basic protein [Phycisphaerales bacterium]|nr:small basic protein [Phycisphaerales bacterium]MCB9840696.1 small basic protein [Phycisphaeraceae bacterium]